MNNVFTFNSKIIAHSVNKEGNDIVTFELCMPKQYVAEFNTHKHEIERNSASSRAIPITTIIDSIIDNPVMPYEWRYNSKGMVATERLNTEDETYANEKWLEARDAMIKIALELQHLPSGRSADKQRVNRLLEPWMWTTIVCTMTGSGGIGVPNFFGLRDADNVQPEFRVVARMMHEQYHLSVPTTVKWHLPYMTLETIEEFWALEDKDVELVCKTLALISSARCGRVTYYKQGQVYDSDNEIARANDFFNSGHFSPLRHACLDNGNEWSGNFFGWKPISKLMNLNDYVPRCCNNYVQKKPVGPVQTLFYAPN